MRQSETMFNNYLSHNADRSTGHFLHNSNGATGIILKSFFKSLFFIFFYLQERHMDNCWLLPKNRNRRFSSNIY